MQQVQDALRPTGIPAFAGAWKATEQFPTVPDQYIVYTTMMREDEHWDDDFRHYIVYVYLNLWTNRDPTDAARRVRDAMRAAGFAMDGQNDSYNDDTRQTLISWTWVIRLGVDL